MEIRRIPLLAIMICFFGLFITPCISKAEVALENQPWPNSSKCKACVPLQFDKLEMHLPLDEIGKILIIDSGGPIMHIMPKTDSPKVGYQFLSLGPDKLIDLYRKSGLLEGLNIETNEQLFDTLGKLPGNNKSLKTLRHLENVDTAKSYTKASKDSVHVYWIRSHLPKGSQRIYFVIDGEETVYLLAGDITQKLYETVLSNLHIVNIP